MDKNYNIELYGNSSRGWWFRNGSEEHFFIFVKDTKKYINKLLESQEKIQEELMELKLKYAEMSGYLKGKSESTKKEKTNDTKRTN